MTPITRDIQKTVICDFLDTEVSYKARLWNNNYEGNSIGSSVIDGVVVFVFNQDYIRKNNIPDGEKLNLSIWNEGHTQSWLYKKAFKVRNNKVTG